MAVVQEDFIPKRIERNERQKEGKLTKPDPDDYPPGHQP